MSICIIKIIYIVVGVHVFGLFMTKPLIMIVMNKLSRDPNNKANNNLFIDRIYLKRKWW